MNDGLCGAIYAIVDRVSRGADRRAIDPWDIPSEGCMQMIASMVEVGFREHAS